MSSECVCHEQINTPCHWCIDQKIMADQATELATLRERVAAAEHNETEIRKHLACRIEAADRANAACLKAEDAAEALRERVRRLEAACQAAEHYIYQGDPIECERRQMLAELRAALDEIDPPTKQRPG